MFGNDAPAGAAPDLGESMVNKLLGVAKAIDGEARSADAPIAGDAPPIPAAAAAPAAIDWHSEAKEVIDFATESFFDLYPRLNEVWTAEKLERTTLRLAAVMEKYNLTFGKLLGKWGPEIMLAVVVVPKVPATYRVIRDTHRELREKKKLEQPPPPAPRPAGAPAPAPAASAPTGPASSTKPAPEFSGPPPAPDPLRLDLRA